MQVPEELRSTWHRRRQFGAAGGEYTKYPPRVMHTPREVDARPHGLSEKTLCVRKRLRVPILATEL